MVEIADPGKPLLPQRARAELVAALAMVDYVVLGNGEPADGIVDAGVTTEFIEHVLRRHRRRSTEMSAPRILVVRLGAMGDVVAALPAVASLKHSIPHSKITWVIEPKWSALLEGNPYIDSVILLDRRTLAGL